MNAPLAAFVLKCPECGAPQPGPDPSCRYCKVPLMWAPARSLGRDDSLLFQTSEVEDDPNCKLMGFGPEPVREGERKIFQFDPQIVCLPTFVWIDPDAAPHFVVRRFAIGVVELVKVGAAGGPLSAKLFSRGRGFPIADGDAMSPGILAVLEVENVTAQAFLIQGALRARTLPPKFPDPGPGYPSSPLRYVGGRMEPLPRSRKR